MTSSVRTRQRLRRPPLRSGPSGDPPGPLRLRQHLGPEGTFRTPKKKLKLKQVRLPFDGDRLALTD